MILRLVRSAALLAVLTPLPGATEAQWVEAPGEAWSHVVLYHQDTRQEFGENGEVRDFFADGHNVTTSLFVTTAVGLVQGLDAWAQISGHDLEFDDAAGSRQQTGLGDVRLWLRAGPELLGLESPVPVALRAGVKLPGADFPVDAEIIPLNEGQRDWEAMLEVGHSFWPAPVYLQGWVGYRLREENEEIFRDPGDEVFYFAAAGGHLGRFEWRVATEGLFGEAPVVEGIRVGNGKRELVEVSPRVGYRFGPLTLQAGVRVPVDGRNFPEGPILTVGSFVEWSLF